MMLLDEARQVGLVDDALSRTEQRKAAPGDIAPQSLRKTAPETTSSSPRWRGPISLSLRDRSGKAYGPTWSVVNADDSLDEALHG